MPTESQRKTKVKRVANPDDTSTFVPVPVITQISFTDQKTFGQEYGFILDNTETNNTRKVKVVTGIDPATGKGGVTDPNGTWKDGSSRLAVERIKQFFTQDQKTFGQDYGHILNNDDDDPGPHKKVHTRYWTFPRDAAMPDPTKEPTGAEAWIKVEQIDELDLTDQKSFAQEQVYILNNPVDGSDIPTDDGEDIPDNKKSTVIDPPWRLDPFQNVVDVSWQARDFVVYGTGVTTSPPYKPFINYSKDGLKWAAVGADSSTVMPPLTGGSGNTAGLERIYKMVYGKGVWLLLALFEPMWKSPDLFKSWTRVNAPGTPPYYADIAYGKPIDAKKTSDDLLIKNGAFVAVWNSNGPAFDTVFAVSKDLGDTWTITNTLSRDVINYDLYTISFINGIFYIVMSGFDPNADQPAPGTVKIWSSRDGLTWDAGTKILSDLSSTPVHVLNGTVYVGVTPIALTYLKTSKKFMLSGTIGGNGLALFHAESTDPMAFASATILGQVTDIQLTITVGANPQAGSGISSASSNNPGYAGGHATSLAVTKNGAPTDVALVAARKTTFVGDSASFTNVNYHPPGSPFPWFLGGPGGVLIDEAWIDASNSQDGVLTASDSLPTFSEDYFTSGTVPEKHISISDPQDFPNQPFPPANSELTVILDGFLPGFVASNGVKDKSNDKALGTFLWAANGNHQSPNAESPYSAGFEIWRSQDGSTFTKVDGVPLASTKFYETAGIATGKVPALPTTK